ncbi:hypothetical protein BOX15_Mlig007104g2 [Macrostomum lignano]|uniref:HEAT repeat domain-containing protein n=2 Tax=Macrostomum lignano TaxID=282301 RepID=A0A267H0G9_9PLAT|nr:hypothetical protein BOX15_Mlig007104g2 [Macrostomum lignano]
MKLKRAQRREPSPENVRPSELPVRQALSLASQTEDMEVVLDLTRHPSPEVRQRALREMCPCRVKTDLSAFWQRVLEMKDDPEARVRQQVAHTLCDGAPNHMEHEVVEVLREFNRDADATVRRMVHKALVSYDRTGRWNVL